MAVGTEDNDGILLSIIFGMLDREGISVGLSLDAAEKDD